VMALGAWIYGHWSSPLSRAVVRLTASAVAGALVLLGLGLGLSQATQAHASAAAATVAGGITWEPWSPPRVAELRARGTPVFVDFTAAWCLTCQVNERVALRTEAVARRFRDAGVVALRADWTSRDAAITRALAEYGRQGVPLYVLYGAEPTRPAVVLPEVITEGVVLNGLNEALAR
jgi:thiol:disulfide interchange protein